MIFVADATKYCLYLWI